MSYDLLRFVEVVVGQLPSGGMKGFGGNEQAHRGSIGAEPEERWIAKIRKIMSAIFVLFFPQAQTHPRSTSCGDASLPVSAERVRLWPLSHTLRMRIRG